MNRTPLWQVGCLWSLKADFATWFGDKVEWIYGIQMMPVTPVSEQLLRADWLAASKSVWDQGLDSESDQWKGILLMAKAILDKSGAWSAAMNLQAFDNGNSKVGGGERSASHAGGVFSASCRAYGTRQNELTPLGASRRPTRCIGSPHEARLKTIRRRPPPRHPHQLIRRATWMVLWLCLG